MAPGVLFMFLAALWRLEQQPGRVEEPGKAQKKILKTPKRSL
jgi:hypothetical protein